MTKYILFFLFLIQPVVLTRGQNLDSLYNAFINIRIDNKTAGHDRKTMADSSHVKCGFAMVSEIKRNLHNYSKEEQRVLSSFLQRPAAQTSIITPAGLFRIHYDLTGTNAPLYDINELALSLDTVYSVEVEQLGYPAPPSDGNLGGDELYDVYIQNLSRGMYGYTQPETDLPGDKHTSFMVIDNDFGNDYYTKGINGAKVTVAHEFHHAIQIGNYIYRSNDIFYYEITSAAMEEFVFDYINDYYAYMPFYFYYPEKTFSTRNTSLDGYDLAIWNIYLKDRFDFDIIKRIWELMPANRALEANAIAIEEYNSSFKNELNQFGLWTYFTGHRAKPGEFFEEAANYPLIRPMGIYELEPSGTDFMIVNSAPVSNNFMIYVDNNDTLVTVITNADIVSGIHANKPHLELRHKIVTEYQSNAVRINSEYYSVLECSMLDYLRQSFIFNNEISDGEIPSGTDDEYAFPQPFSYTNHTFIHIPAASNESGNADLNIYSISMNLIYSGLADLYGGEKKFIKWNGRKDNGDKLSTGIYIYVTKSGDSVKKGKIVIYNE